MSHKDVVISGFGGQGVILTGLVLGKTVSIYSDGYATMTQNFGPEARGGACTAQVVVDDKPIRYPYVRKPDILVAMSQEAYEKHCRNLSRDGLLLYDVELVSPDDGINGIRSYSIPAARFAEELGNPMALNMVMFGFLAGTSSIVEPEAAKKAISVSVPSQYIELNMTAFDTGYKYGKGELAREAIEKTVSTLQRS